MEHFPIQRGKGLVNRLLGSCLTIEVGGCKVRILNPLEFHQRSLLSGASCYEPEVTSLFARCLREGMVFLDVGANLGIYALFASQRVGPVGQVHAFEPAPEQFQHLKINVGLNQIANVKLNNLAVSDSEGRAQLFLSTSWNRGTHSLGRTLGQTVSCAVETITLDGYITREKLQRVDVVKIDVEGAEFLVLRGARGLVRSLRPSLIVVEAAEDYARALGHSTADLKHLLEEYGYRVYRIGKSGSLERVDAATTEAYSNLAAVHGGADQSWFEALGLGRRLPPLASPLDRSI